MKRRSTPPGVTDGAEARPSNLRPADSLTHSAAGAHGRWFALWVISNAEFVVRDALRRLKLETFLPTWTEIVQWSDRKKSTVRPLFPGYLFVRCDGDVPKSVFRIAGVIQMLPTSLNPAPVDASEIETIQQLLASGLPIASCDFVQGDEVTIDSGPLAGIRGLVQRTRNGTRVVVKFELFKRAVSAELDAGELVKAKQEKKAA